MKSIEQLLENLASRGEPRGAAAVWARATSAATDRPRRANRHRRLALAVAGLVVLAGAGAAVLRSDGSRTVVETRGGPDSTVRESSGRLFTCTMWHGDQFASVEMNAASVPSSINVTVDSDHRFLVEVYVADDGKKQLRVSVFSPSSDPTPPGLPSGAVGAASGPFEPGSDRVNLSGTFADGVRFTCADEVSRREDASGTPVAITGRPVVRSVSDSCFEVAASESAPPACLMPGVSYWQLNGQLYAVARSPIQFTDGSSEPLGADGLAVAMVGNRVVNDSERSPCSPMELAPFARASPIVARYPWISTRCSRTDAGTLVAAVEVSPRAGESRALFLRRLGDGWVVVGQYTEPGAVTCGRLTGPAQETCRALGISD